MNQLIDEKNIKGKITVPKYPLDSANSYELNETVPWVKALLLELNENVETKLPEEYLETSHLEIKLVIEKKFNGTYGEYLLISGSLETEYHTVCVRTSAEMKESLEVEFKACYIDDQHQENEELQDQIDIFMDGDVYELYFYDNRQADIKLLIHEQLFLNYNQYPVSDYDAEIHWAKDTSTTKQ